MYSYYDRNDEHFFVDRVVTAEEWKNNKNLEQLHVDSISINPDGWITLLFPLKNHSESSICLLEYYYDKTVGSQFGETLYEERKRIFTNNYTSYDLALTGCVTLDGNKTREVPVWALLSKKIYLQYFYKS